jgi:hypothetical protein
MVKCRDTSTPNDQRELSATHCARVFLPVPNWRGTTFAATEAQQPGKSQMTPGSAELPEIGGRRVWRGMEIGLAAFSCGADEVGRGEGQGYFAQNEEMWVRIPPGQNVDQ